VGHIRKFSDTLLIFALKAELLEKYRDRYPAPGAGKQMPVTFTLNIPRPALKGLPEKKDPEST